MKFKTIVVISDVHLDSLSKDVEYKLVHKFIKDIKPSEVVINGDFMDLGCISHFNKLNIRAVEDKRIKEDFKKANRYIRDLRKYTDKIVYIEGNHENWIEQAIDKHPAALEGNIELYNNIHNVDKFIMHYNDNASNFYKLGHLYIVHGCYAGAGAARRYLKDYDVNLIFGHTHAIRQESKTNIRQEPTSVWNMGCLCPLNPSYLRGRLPQWQLGFIVVHLFNDGTFDVRQIRIINNKFIYNGRVYK